MSCVIKNDIFVINSTIYKNPISIKLMPQHIYNNSNNNYYICDSNDIILLNILIGLNEIFIHYKNNNFCFPINNSIITYFTRLHN
jgi:hypothetical protein